MDDEFYSDDGRSTNPTRPTSALDSINRQNLLKVVLEGTRNTNKKCLLHRLIYVGRLNPEVRNPVELGENYKNYFRSAVANADKTTWQTEQATGLLLLYPSYFVHILEGPENLLFSVIEENLKKEDNTMLDCKVLVYVNNITGRFYGTWQYHVLTLKARQIDASKHEDSFENTITDAITLLHKLSAEFIKAKAQMKGAMDLVGKYSHLLLPQDVIECLLGLSELMSFNDFALRYMSPFQVTLDEEVMWPMQEFPPQIVLGIQE